MAAIITVGGLGAINYLIAEKVGTLDIHNTSDAKTIALFTVLAVPDYALYIIVNYVFSKYLSGLLLTFFNISITFVLAVLVTIVFAKPISNIFYWLINRNRSLNHQPAINQMSAWEYLTEIDKPQMAYIYDFAYTPLGSGYISFVSDNELNIVPFTKDNDYPQTPYEELMKEVETTDFKEKYDVQQHIDMKNKFIMISIIEN